MTNISQQLLAWFADTMPHAQNVRFGEELSQLTLGHSNETFVVHLRWEDDEGATHDHEYVVRAAPSGPALLEPYDLRRQFQILEALQGTEVPVPGVGRFEADSSVLGRPFLSMDRVDGVGFEREIPEYARHADRAKKLRMAKAAIDAMAAIHRIDWRARGLDSLGDGTTWARDEVRHWVAGREADYDQPLPAFDAVAEWLDAHRPEPSPSPALIHGDFKLSNLLWRDEEVVAVLDWEMSSIGDPLVDLAYFIVVMYLPGHDNFVRDAMTPRQIADYYGEITGTDVGDLSWYEALVEFKLAAIYLRMFALFSTGFTDDLRFMAGGERSAGAIARAIAKTGQDLGAEMPPMVPTDERLVAACQTSLRDLLIPELQSELAITQGKLMLGAIARLGTSNEHTYAPSVVR